MTAKGTQVNVRNDDNINLSFFAFAHGTLKVIPKARKSFGIPNLKEVLLESKGMAQELPACHCPVMELLLPEPAEKASHEPKTEIFDPLTFGGKQLLVFGSNIKAFRPERGVVYVIGKLQVCDIIPLRKLLPGELVKSGVIGFKPHIATGFQETLVNRQEPWACKPAFDVAHARPGIRERNPDFADLTFGKEVLNQQNHRAQKSCIGQIVFCRGGTALPDSLALDIHPDIISFGKEFCQPDRVLAPATGKFNGDGIVVFEKILVPVSLDRMIEFFARFNHIRLTFDHLKTFEFPFHKFSISATTNVLPPIKIKSSSPAEALALAMASFTSVTTSPVKPKRSAAIFNRPASIALGIEAWQK